MVQAVLELILPKSSSSDNQSSFFRKCQAAFCELDLVFQDIKVCLASFIHSDTTSSNIFVAQGTLIRLPDSSRCFKGGFLGGAGRTSCRRGRFVQIVLNGGSKSGLQLLCD